MTCVWCSAVQRTETSQLIGQWLPASQVSPSATLQPSAALLLQRLIKLATCQCLQSLRSSAGLEPVAQQLGRLLSSMPASWLDSEAGTGFASGTASSGLQLLPDAQLQQLLQTVHTLSLLLGEQHSLLPGSAQSALRHLETQLMQLQEQLSNKQSSHGISFVWVESLLVTAMREGHWVGGNSCCLSRSCSWFLWFSCMKGCMLVVLLMYHRCAPIRSQQSRACIRLYYCHRL